MSLKGKILKILLRKKTHKPINHKEVHKILLIRNARIGDAVCAFPLLRELKNGFPNAEIDVYAGRHSDFLFKKLPYVKNVFTKFRKKNFYRTWSQIQLMKSRKYDLIVEAMPMKFGLELSVWYMKPRWIVSLGASCDDQNLNIHRDDLTYYDALKPKNNNQHMVEYLCGLLPLVGIYNYSTKMEFPKDNKKYIYAQEFISKLPPGKKIALNVDSSSLTRNLYKEQIIQLAHALNDYTLILLSLPSRQKEMKEIIQNQNLQNCILSYPTETIYDAAELLRSCDLLISPDTSLIHIASALDLPTIGIYRNDDYHINLWGPLSSMHHVVRSSIDGYNTIEGFDISDVAHRAYSFLEIEKMTDKT